MQTVIVRRTGVRKDVGDKTRGKEDGGEIHAEITWDIIAIEETGRPGRHFDAWRANANVSTDQKEIHSHGSQKSAVPKKKCERKVAAVARDERSEGRIRATADTRKWSGSECNKK